MLALVLSSGVAAAVPTAAADPSIGRSVSGTPGNDVLVGTMGPDTIYGLGGNDVILGLLGDDVLIGGPGNDNVLGGLGDDDLLGGGGSDTLGGGLGTDEVYASDGDRDRVLGGPGADSAWVDQADLVVLAESVVTITKPIVFDRGSGSPTFDYDIWSMALNGTGQVNLTNDATMESRNPTISPNGTKIAFEREDGVPGDFDFDIWVMGIDGSGKVNLTADSPAHDLDPAWSPDGSKIAFASERDTYAEIYTMNANGTNVTRLTFNTAIVDDHPSWSPDGSKIAFSSGPFDEPEPANYDIWTINSDGTAPTQLTTDAADDWYPDWSPDGTKIVWTRIKDVLAGVDPQSWLWIINPDGSGQQQLAPALSLFKQLAPSWCPDAQRLSFAGSPTLGGFDIWTIGSGGASPTQLTNQTHTDFFSDCGG